MTKQRARKADRPWIDTGEFTRSAGSLGAVQPACGMSRLREVLSDDTGEIAWTLTGERRTRAEGGTDQFMRLRIVGDVRMPCVRCLRPVDVAIDERRLFKPALTESQAEREDAEAEDFDVLAASPRFDVLELVEDEAIMSLPIAPRHAGCALPAHVESLAEPADDDKPNPFAVLEGLKGRRGGGQDRD